MYKPYFLYPIYFPRWFDIYVIELTKLIVRIRGNLSKLERKVIVALVTTDVHARDIIDELYENKVQREGRGDRRKLDIKNTLRIPFIRTSCFC